MNANNTWLPGFFLDKIGPGKAFSNKMDMARFLDVPKTQVSTFYNFLKGADTQYSAVFSWFQKIGGVIGTQEKAQREVCFVNTRVINAEDGAPPIVPEDYLAVPIVSEAGAGPGVVPLAEHESWFLVYREEPSIKMRSDLIAVRIAKGSTSMEPTLHPNDIVLVDRQDKTVTRAGGIWLVMEPDGSGKVKRVKIDTVREMRHTRITFYSDNVAENPPEVYTLETDYNGDINRAIVGRVVWAWTDLSRK